MEISERENSYVKGTTLPHSTREGTTRIHTGKYTHARYMRGRLYGVYFTYEPHFTCKNPLIYERVRRRMSGKEKDDIYCKNLVLARTYKNVKTP